VKPAKSITRSRLHDTEKSKAKDTSSKNPKDASSKESKGKGLSSRKPAKMRKTS
jgi:hypothetical protein